LAAQNLTLDQLLPTLGFQQSSGMTRHAVTHSYMLPNFFPLQAT